MHDGGLQLCQLRIWQLRIWTDVADGVDPGTQPATILAAANAQVSFDTLVWDPERATISACCTATVHPDNADWMSKVLATAAALQNAAAHSVAHTLAAACGGRPAQSDHPSSGQRPAMDDMLNLPAGVILPTGARPSQYAGPCAALDAFFAEYAHLHWFGSSDATGATLQVPYTSDTPAVFLPAGAVTQRPETALVQVFTNVAHPKFGNGALVITRLPVSPGTERAAMLANELNLAEFRGDVHAPPLLGAWCPDFLSEGADGLTFCNFLPNLLADDTILKNWMLQQRIRSLWAREILDR